MGSAMSKSHFEVTDRREEPSRLGKGMGKGCAQGRRNVANIACSRSTWYCALSPDARRDACSDVVGKVHIFQYTIHEPACLCTLEVLLDERAEEPAVFLARVICKAKMPIFQGIARQTYRPDTVGDDLLCDNAQKTSELCEIRRHFEYLPVLAKGSTDERLLIRRQ